MVTINEIQDKVDKLLGIITNNLNVQYNGKAIEKVYEAYVFGLCKKAVEDAGGTAKLVGINSGLSPKIVVLRGAPGKISSTSQDYTYIQCDLNGKKFEIHLDIEYEGRSGASHEIDISIIESCSADRARKSGSSLKAKEQLMIFECKFYLNSIPSTSLAREFLGLLQDCSKNELNAFVANNGSYNLRKYFSNKKEIEPFVDLNVTNKAAEDRFCRVVEQKLRKWAV